MTAYFEEFHINDKDSSVNLVSPDRATIWKVLNVFNLDVETILPTLDDLHDKGARLVHFDIPKYLAGLKPEKKTETKIEELQKFLRNRHITSFGQDFYWIDGPDYVAYRAMNSEDLEKFLQLAVEAAAEQGVYLNGSIW